MMGRLHLRYQKWLEGDELDHGVVANLYPVPPSGRGVGRVAHDLRNVLIPAGRHGSRVVDVTPGRYLVECALPSGEILSEEVDVRADADVELHLRSEQSPHEWLSWHQFAGHIPGREEYERRARQDGTFQPAVQRLEATQRPGGRWTQLGRLDGRDPSALTGPLGVRAWHPSTSATYDDQVELHRFSSADRPPEPWMPPPRRNYLLVETPRESELVSVPVPWIDVKTEEPVPVEVLVRRHDRTGEGAAAITVRDRTLGSALAYLDGGALPAAQRMFHAAEEMLYLKLTNPLGAAAGGYVLLGTEQGSDRKPWHQWIANLREWFAWLPDGAIQHAALTLRHRQSADDVDAAKEGLREAYRRGLPFYSIGLRWLADGLSYFADDDPDLARMLLAVRRVSWRANLREPFTVLRLRGE